MGTVKNGLPNGQGQLCYSHGGKYIGSWKDGKKDGLGTMPHAFIGYAGSTLRAAELYAKYNPNEKLIILVDYFG